MSAVFDRPSPWRRIRPVFTGFDMPLIIAMLLLAAAGLTTMYSAGFDSGTRFSDHGRNMLLAFGVLFMAAQVSPQTLMRAAVPLYTIGVALLVAVAVAGVTKKGATRWLNVGIVIQPSEVMKIAMPLVLAWVVPAPRRPPACARLPDRAGAARGAGRADRQAARSRHRDPGALGRDLRDLLRRPVMAG